MLQCHGGFTLGLKLPYSGEQRMPGERILVADDEEDILDLCHRILAADGCKVSIANNGQEAIDAISTQAFDLLLTDVNMPGLTGLEASQVVKQINPNVIIVVMTAFATKETAIEALKLGVDEFVVKPFSPDELSLAVEKALEKERLRRENSRLQAMIPLFELNKLFMGQLTLSVLLPEVLAIAQREVKADFAGLFLMEEAGNLTFHGRNHLDETSDQALRSVGQSLAEEALLSQEPVTLGGPDPADRIGPVETLADWSVIVNPLVAKETSVGALMVAKRRASFAPSDGDFLAVLSSQVAIAIENARLFAEVQQAYEDLKVLDHMKSEFINIAAHELRTPLAILLGYASILGETTTGDEQNYVNIIIRNATRLRALIDDMLNMGYIETGKAQCSSGRGRCRSYGRHALDSPGEIVAGHIQHYRRFPSAVHRPPETGTGTIQPSVKCPQVYARRW
jgi:CheY-like chemotaxis protein